MKEPFFYFLLIKKNKIRVQGYVFCLLLDIGLIYKYMAFHKEKEQKRTGRRSKLTTTTSTSETNKTKQTKKQTG